jgi:hypothetical protein
MVRVIGNPVPWLDYPFGMISIVWFSIQYRMAGDLWLKLITRTLGCTTAILNGSNIPKLLLMTPCNICSNLYVYWINSQCPSYTYRLLQMLHGVIRSNFGILLPFKIAVVHTYIQSVPCPQDRPRSTNKCPALVPSFSILLDWVKCLKAHNRTARKPPEDDERPFSGVSSKGRQMNMWNKRHHLSANFKSCLLFHMFICRPLEETPLKGRSSSSDDRTARKPSEDDERPFSGVSSKGRQMNMWNKRQLSSV